MSKKKLDDAGYEPPPRCARCMDASAAWTVTVPRPGTKELPSGSYAVCTSCSKGMPGKAKPLRQWRY